MISLLKKKKSSKEIKQLTHIILGAHYKIKSKFSIFNEPPFLVKHKALLSSSGIDNTLIIQGTNEGWGGGEWIYEAIINHDSKTHN